MHGNPREAPEMPKKFDPMNQKTEEAVQCPEDQRAPGYDNNHPMDWVRGAGEDATTMPHYDKSKKWK
jgi:hypothetical protein